jgi:eukaryotic-like serine/threonine-protein kinase
VLLADDGATVKITDFGISRATGDVQVTATGMLAGTPAYLAPEVAKGEPPGPPSDVFSLGSTLYAAVEGHPPFGNIDNTLALLHAVAAGRTIPPRQAGPLTGTVQQMLSTNPDARPTMSEVVRILGAIAAGQAPLMSGPPSGPTTGPTAMVLPPPRPVDSQTTVRTRSTGQPTPPPMRAPAGSMPSMAAPGAASAWPPKRIARYAAAILAAALVGILVANMFTDTGSNAAEIGYTGSLTPAEQTMDQPAPGAASSIMTTTPTTTTTQSDNGFSAMKSAVEEYFGLLPAQPQQAFLLLTPAEQARNGGPIGYQMVWAQVSAVHVDSVTPHGPKSVLAKVTVVTKAGQTTSTNAAFGFESSNGQLLISDITQAPANPGKHGG